MKKLLLSAVAASALLLTGCSTSTSIMKSAEHPITAIPENKAVLTFFRPSQFHGAGAKPLLIQKVKGGVAFVGAIENGCKIRNTVEPGEHEFAVQIQGGANLLKAKLEPNKAYYVKITTNEFGMNNAGGVNVAIHREAFADPKVVEEIKSTELREKSAKAPAFFAGHESDLLNALFLAEDNYKEEPADLLKINTLYPEDGIKELY